MSVRGTQHVSTEQSRTMTNIKASILLRAAHSGPPPHRLPIGKQRIFSCCFFRREPRMGKSCFARLNVLSFRFRRELWQLAHCRGHAANCKHCLDFCEAFQLLLHQDLCNSLKVSAHGGSALMTALPCLAQKTRMYHLKTTHTHTHTHTHTRSLLVSLDAASSGSP